MSESTTPKPQTPQGITLHHATAGAQHVSPGTAPLPCPQCGVIENPALGPGSGPHHASARCRHCGHFIRWLSTRSPAKRQARRQQARQEAMAQKPPNSMQLAFLRSPGDADPPPANMAEASTRIDMLKRGEVRV